MLASAMMTVSQLARTCGLSRTTILYYESVGLLSPAFRSPSGYRRYGEREVERLRRIRLYREAGISVEQIRLLLDDSGPSAAGVLASRLGELQEQARQLRQQQQLICRLIHAGGEDWRSNMIDKQKWVSIMKASGFDEAQMRQWHIAFEREAPDEHAEFLRYLHIPEAEAEQIRAWSRKG